MKECHLGRDIFVQLQTTIEEHNHHMFISCVNKIYLNIYINNMNFVDWVIEILFAMSVSYTLDGV